MGLLDDVMGALTHGTQQPGQQPPQDGSTSSGSASGSGGLGDLVGGLLRGGGQQAPHTGAAGASSGGLGDVLGGMLGGGNGNARGGLADVLGSLLGNDGHVGGLGGLLDRFKQAGLGDQAHSWVGNGPNAPVSGEQVDQALGHDTLGNLAGRLGLNPSMLGGLLASVLPMVIDRLTPHGQVPEQGLGDQHDVQQRLNDSL